MRRYTLAPGKECEITIAKEVIIEITIYDGGLNVTRSILGRSGDKSYVHNIISGSATVVVSDSGVGKFIVHSYGWTAFDIYQHGTKLEPFTVKSL